MGFSARSLLLPARTVDRSKVVGPFLGCRGGVVCLQNFEIRLPEFRSSVIWVVDSGFLGWIGDCLGDSGSCPPIGGTDYDLGGTDVYFV